METPEKREPIVLSQHDIDAKFNELGMLPMLNDKATYCLVKVTSGINGPSSKYRKPSKFDWKWERFERINDSKGFAIIKWRKLLTGGDEMRVIQFMDFEGNFFMTDETTSVSKEGV